MIYIYYVVFAFQGSEKDKRKEAAEKEEKAKKVAPIFRDVLVFATFLVLQTNKEKHFFMLFLSLECYTNNSVDFWM